MPAIRMSELEYKNLKILLMNFFREISYSTIKEVSLEFGLTMKRAGYHMNQLERKGYLEKYQIVGDRVIRWRLLQYHDFTVEVSPRKINGYKKILEKDDFWIALNKLELKEFVKLVEQKVDETIKNKYNQ